MITGCSDSELRVWKISSSGIESDTEESGKSSEKPGSKRSAKEAGLNEESEEKTAEVSRILQLSCYIEQTFYRAT